MGAFFINLQARSFSFPSGRIPRDAKSDFALIAEAWNTIHDNYVDRASIKPNPLKRKTIIR